MEVNGKLLQSRGLALVQGGIAFRIVTHEYFTERGLKRLDVTGEIRTVLEVELALAALLGRARGVIPVRASIAQDSAAELLVHKNSGLLLTHTGNDRSPRY